MRDKELREQVKRLEARIIDLECNRDHVITVTRKESPVNQLVASFPFKEITVKKVVLAILDHLGLDIETTPAQPEKISVLKRAKGK